MAYHIVWKNLDGTITIDSFKPNLPMEEVLIIKAKKISQYFQFCAIVNTSELPHDRYFRPAWRWGGAAITFDLQACRERHLNKLRRARNSKLQDSDSDFIRALEQGNQTQLDALKAYRQALRDMPQNSAAEFSNATTPETIKVIRPAILDAAKP